MPSRPRPPAQVCAPGGRAASGTGPEMGERVTLYRSILVRVHSCFPDLFGRCCHDLLLRVPVLGLSDVRLPYVLQLVLAPLVHHVLKFVRPCLRDAREHLCHVFTTRDQRADLVMGRPNAEPVSTGCLLSTNANPL